MAIYGSLVMKNEADRYLEPCLKHMAPLFDGLFVYDDRSNDSSVDIAVQYASVVVVRGEGEPSFMEHEGNFRYNAWREFERQVNPLSGDWVLSFDADEFLVSDEGDARKSLELAVESAAGAVGVIIPFPEVFGVEGGVPQIRVDGLWPTVKGPRFFAYRIGGRWSKKAMGCGSEPDYVGKGPFSKETHGLSMLHFGYAKHEDVETKYKRYSTLTEHGHADRHIQSIPKKPELKPWDGPIPKWEL